MMDIESILILLTLFLISIPIVLIILFVRTSSLKHELASLREQLQLIRARILADAPTAPAPGTSATVSPTPPAAAPDQAPRFAAATSENILKTPGPEPTAPRYESSNWESNRFDAAVSHFTDRVTTLVKSYFTEGNLIVRVGIIILFFGVAFLFKYAAEHSMLPVEFRLIGAAAGGIALLLLGWRLRIKRTGYALALQGGGIGVLYLTLFAAFRVFHLLPAGWVFICMLIMVVLSAILAILQDSKSLAVLAVSGGFLAPVLTSTGSGSHIALFTYYTILNIGILGIAWFKSWRLLNLVGFAFTFVIGTAWGVTQYRSNQFASTETFLIIFFLFYVAIALLFARRQPPELKGFVDGTMVFGVPIVAFSLQAGLVHQYEYGLAWSSFVLGAFYITLAWWQWIRGGQPMRLLSETFLAMGVVFATLTIPFALDGEWIATAWALEGAAIVWISIRQQRRLRTAFGLALQLFAGIGFLAESGGRYAEWPVLNSVFIGAMFVALAGMFSSYLLYKNYAGQKRWEARLIIPFYVWGLLWWFGNGFAEIDDHVDYLYQFSAIIGFIAGSAAVLGLIEKRYNWTTLKHTITGLAVALVGLVLIALAEKAHPFVDGGYWAWTLMFIVFYGLLRLRDSFDTKIKTVPAAHVIGLLSLTILLAVEFHWQLMDRYDLSGAWLTMSAALVTLLIINIVLRFERWPVTTHNRTYLSWGLAPLAAYLLLWSILANIASDGQMAPLPYLPFINPLDIVQVLVLISLFDWWRQYRQLGNVNLTSTQIAVALAGITFYWLNGVLLRSLHHWYDISYDFEEMWDTLLVQACLSVFWTLLGLAVMIVASRKGWRNIWIAAASLLGIVIVKLIIVDLSGREALETIISFIVVGLLLLVVGYFSPLPPKEKITTGE
ncbi:MAG: DUF2339 domain-containing protein [Gammaproteobacteria bacterium]|nr:DUF2339 domain-containing protein [Gammaproteobacteria bacterium]